METAHPKPYDRGPTDVPSAVKTRAHLWTIPLEPAVFVACAAAVLVFLFLRLGQIPSGLFADQTFMGWEGRCLDKTLADDRGNVLPLFFPFFDWLSPIPIYSIALSEAVLGATPLAVALPSTICALGMALGVFLTLRWMTGRPVLARWMALLSLLAPSVFFYARYAFEASYLPCFLMLALAALLRFEGRPSWARAAMAGLALGACTYTYPTGRMLAPLLVAVAAASFWFHAPARRYLPALLGSAAAMGAPMAVFMLRFPGRLLTRLQDNAAWRNSPSPWETLRREIHTYYQHFAQVDFLFRTGQHVVWHNAGEGLLPVWMAGPLLLALGSLWMRRRSPFVRTLAAAMLLSPLPVALTLQQDFPHTSRSLQFVPLAFVAAGLAIHDFFLRDRPLPAWIAALAVAGALAEGAQDLSIYFGDYAAAQQRAMDNDLGSALRMAFDLRSDSEPMTLPGESFDAYRVQFWGDLDPRRVRSEGLDTLGIHAASPSSPPSAGILVLSGASAPPANSVLLASTPLDRSGPPAWRIYRLSPR